VNEDLLGLIEAAYDVDASETDWLAGMVRVSDRLFARGLGAAIYTYQYREHDPIIGRLQVSEGFDIAWLARYRARMGAAPDLVSPIEWQRWFHQRCGTAHTTPNLDTVIRALPEFGGARDVFGINGRDPEGFGVFLAVPQPRPMPLAPQKREIYSRVAAHFASGYRLRRRLAGQRSTPDGADAVLARDGALLHAVGVARGNDARSQLTRAARSIARARSRSGRRDHDRATRAWRGLVDGRWTLVDCFDQGDERFVLAKRNGLQLREGLPLSERERQVLAFAALEHSNKEIAYELGLAAATVRVLMARAARKLGARGREDAVARFRKLEPTP
jgi:DNA-binding CsgD family transcriptional regulator